MKVAVIGGGIGGLAFALGLHKRGLDCEVYEAVPEVKEIGVGITILPHAMTELAALGLQAKLESLGIENEESVFFNRFGQFIYKEPRGRYAGYKVPEVGIHRGRLHRVLYEAAIERLGAGKIHTNRRCVSVEQNDHEAIIHFIEGSTGKPLPSIKADIAVACDGVNSAVRKQFYPNEKLMFAGINFWRGITRHKPILTGKSYVRIGSIETGKIVLYPIIDNIDGKGNQLINWATEIRRADCGMNDWNKKGELADFADVYKDWKFPWLDVPNLLATADEIFEHPMVDKDPVSQWTFGRITLMGDAAHPMYPRGSNGSAQAIIDGRVLAQLLLESNGDWTTAMVKYDAVRRPATAKVVETNRSTPPDFINIKVEELTGGKPFDNIDDVVSQEELRKISEDYKKVAGFALAKDGAVG